MKKRKFLFAVVAGLCTASSLAKNIDLNPWIGPNHEKSRDIFASGSEEELKIFLFAGIGDGMWESRAKAMMAPVIGALVSMRDGSGVEISKYDFAKSASLKGYVSLSMNERVVESKKEDSKKYLESVPGYRHGQIEQTETSVEQHGYLGVQWLKRLEIENYQSFLE
jgi:hypothetical protein